MKRMPTRNGDENDAMYARRYIKWGKREIRRIKRAYRRAERRWLDRLHLPR